MGTIAVVDALAAWASSVGQHIIEVSGYMLTTILSYDVFLE
jgi:hypothetical protein